MKWKCVLVRTANCTAVLVFRWLLNAKECRYKARKDLLQAVVDEMESDAQNPLKGYVHTMHRQQYEDNKEPPRSPMCAMCSTPYPEQEGT